MMNNSTTRIKTLAFVIVYDDLKEKKKIGFLDYLLSLQVIWMENQAN